MKRAIHHHTAVTTGSSQLLQPDLPSLVKFPVNERDENSSHQQAHEDPLEVILCLHPICDLEANMSPLG